MTAYEVFMVIVGFYTVITGTSTLLIALLNFLDKRTDKKK